MSGRSIDIEAMRIALQQNRIEWHRHALERMLERHITRVNICEVLLFGERIEDYSGDQPWPSALFLGWVGQRPLHVVAAFDIQSDVVAVITAYEPSQDRFQSDFTTRKEK